MKEFEKWWQENMPKDMCYESAHHKELLKDGWKAALKFALIVAPAWRKCGVPTEIEEIIEKELGEG